MPFILCEYLDGIPAKGRGRGGLPQFDIASGGSGFHQVLLLLSFFYARPATVFLLDEPDAHLHAMLQRQIYDRLRAVASRRDCQLIIATHSEVILDSTDPGRVVSFLGKPHPLVRADQRDQVREAMSRLTTLELLLAEQGRAVLYCEGESDFQILNPLADSAAIVSVPASKELLPQMFEVAGRPLEKRDFYLIAQNMRAEEIHPEVVRVLDAVSRLLPDGDLETT